MNWIEKMKKKKHDQGHHVQSMCFHTLQFTVYVEFFFVFFFQMRWILKKKNWEKTNESNAVCSFIIKCSMCFFSNCTTMAETERERERETLNFEIHYSMFSLSIFLYITLSLTLVEFKYIFQIHVFEINKKKIQCWKKMRKENCLRKLNTKKS